MNKSEYLEKRSALRVEHEAKQSTLAREYVLANSVSKVGDFIRDHVGTILVEKITHSYGFSRDFPEALYYGKEYTKTGKPFKSGSKRNIWGGNVVAP